MIRVVIVTLVVLTIAGCGDDEYRRLEAGYRLEMLSCWKANAGNEGMCTEKYNNQINKLKERFG